MNDVKKFADDPPTCLPPRGFSFPGSLLPSLGYSRCCHCRRPWYAAEPHCVSCGGGRAQFAVCDRCWPELATEQRLGYHAWVSYMVWSSITREEWSKLATTLQP